MNNQALEKAITSVLNGIITPLISQYLEFGNTSFPEVLLINVMIDGSNEISKSKARQTVLDKSAKMQINNGIYLHWKLTEVPTAERPIEAWIATEGEPSIELINKITNIVRKAGVLKE